MTTTDGPYEYELDPLAENNTAATVLRLALSGGERVLDLGCGPGIVAGHLASVEGRKVTCIDASQESLDKAEGRGVQRSFVADLNAGDWCDLVADEQFDVVILADVLEHLLEPADTLSRIVDNDLLSPDGFIIVSIPNAGHEAVIAELASGRFDYRSDGLLDRTHLRFFTRQSFTSLANRTGLHVVQLERTTRSMEATEFRSHSVLIPNELRRGLAEFNAEGHSYQFIFKLVPGSADTELTRVQHEQEALLASLTDAKHDKVMAEREAKDLAYRLKGLEGEHAALTNTQRANERELDDLRLRAERLADAEAVAADRQLTIAQLRARLTELRREMSRGIETQAKARAKVTKERNSARKEIRQLERQIKLIHQSETWRIGRVAKQALTPVVFAKKWSDRRRKPAPSRASSKAVGAAPTETKDYLTPSYRLEENLEVRAKYEEELARTEFSGSGRRIAFAIYTSNLDEGRGDVFVAVGLGRRLRELGWDVLYVPRDRWDQFPPDTEIVVAMLPTIDPTIISPSTRVVAWLRNETQAWCDHPALNVFSAALCSSPASAADLRDRFNGPVDILPIGVDTELFTEPAQASRVGIATTVNQWGRERQVYAALRSLPVEFPLALYGKHMALGEQLDPHQAGLVSFFALPSLYQQVTGVIDDLNHTTKPYGNINSRVYEAAACGAMVITNSSRGLRELELDEIPAYISHGELHDLASQVNAGDYARAAQRIAERVRSKHSYVERALTFDAISKTWGDPAPLTTRVVGFFPDYRSTNPYQEMLYGSLPDTTRALPIRDIFRLDLIDRCVENGQEFVLHLHWTAPILASASTEAEALSRVDRVLRELDRLHSNGGRLLWTVHNTMPHETRWPAIEKSLRQELAIRADDIHVMCNQTPAEAEAAYHLPSAKVRVVPHSSYRGVYPSVVSREVARARLGLGSSDTVFLFLGGIRPYKALDRLLESFERLHYDDPAVKLLIAGRPGKFPGVAELEERCHRTPGVLANFNTVRDEELQVYYQAADVAVFPYRKGLNSGAVLLSLTFGTPVVAPQTGCLDQILQPEFSETFNPEDDDELLRALNRCRRLASAEAQSAALSAAGQYTPEMMASDFVSEILDHPTS